MVEWSDSTRRALRTGLAIVGLQAAFVGVWALAAPHSFYANFPGGGRHWVAPFGGYDEHLVRDLGSFELALVSVALFAFVTLDRRVVQAALVAFVVSGVPHLAFHASNTDSLSTLDNALSLASLAVGVVVPLVLLPLTRARRVERARPG